MFVWLVLLLAVWCAAFYALAVVPDHQTSNRLSYGARNTLSQGIAVMSGSTLGVALDLAVNSSYRTTRETGAELIVYAGVGLLIAALLIAFGHDNEKPPGAVGRCAVLITSGMAGALVGSAASGQARMSCSPLCVPDPAPHADWLFASGVAILIVGFLVLYATQRVPVDGSGRVLPTSR